MKVYIFFQDLDADWTDITDLTLDKPSITTRAASDNFHHATDMANFTLNYDATVFEKIRTTVDAVLVKITDDAGVRLFTGYFLANYTNNYNGIVDIQFLTIEAQDYTEFLNVDAKIDNVEQEITYTNIKLSDFTDHNNSLIHQLVKMAYLEDVIKIGFPGYVSMVNPAFYDTTVIESFSIANSDNILSTMDTLLFEFGYVLNWNISGVISPVKWILDTGATPTYTFNDTNIAYSVSEKITTSAYDGVELTWYTIGTKDNVLIYAADVPKNERNEYSGEPILTSLYWPDEANVIDDVTGTNQVIYQEYTDSGIRLATSTLDYNQWDLDFTLSRAKFSGILATSNHARVSKFEPPFGLIEEDYYNTKARILYRNSSSETAYLYYLYIYATVLYRQTEQKYRDVFRIRQAPRYYTYTSTYLYNSTVALKLYKGLRTVASNGNKLWTFSSEEQVAVGTYVSIVLNNGSSATGLLIESVYDDYTRIYEYTVVGMSSTYTAPTEHSVTTISAPEGSIYTPPVQITGDTQFVYIGSRVVPDVSSITLSAFVDTTVPALVYQWYARNGSGVDVAIVGETNSTLTIPFDAPYLTGDSTVISCKINSLYSGFTIVTNKRFGTLEVEIGSGISSISYNSADTSPLPAGPVSFTAALFENDIYKGTGVDYEWTATGAFSITGDATLSGVTVNIAQTNPLTDTFIQCAITYSGITTIGKRLIGYSKYTDTYRAVISSGISNISYNQYDISPIPSNNQTYYSTFYANNSPVISGVTYDWEVGGSYSLAGPSTNSSVEVSISATKTIYPTYVQCTFTYGGVTYTERTNIAVSSFNDVYNSVISSGIANISYDQFDTNPVPSNNQTYNVTFYKNNEATTSGVSYFWSTGGSYSLVGSPLSSAAEFAINPEKQFMQTFVQCAVTYMGYTKTHRIDIPTSLYNTIYSAKIFGDVVNISYDQLNGNPVPSGILTYSTAMYKNNIIQTSGVSYNWYAFGNVSIVGDSTLSGISVQIADEKAYDNASVACLLQQGTNSLYEIQNIGISSYQSQTPVVIQGGTQFTVENGASVPSPNSITLTVTVGSTGSPTYQWYYKDTNDTGADFTILPGQTFDTLTISSTAVYLTDSTTFKCVINGNDNLVAYHTINKVYLDAYNLVISSGISNISYDQFGLDPYPNTNQTFYATLYKNNITLSSGVSYAWSTEGNLNVYSGETTNAFITSISGIKVADNSYVACVATYNGISFASIKPISTSVNESYLDLYLNGLAVISYDQFGTNPIYNSSTYEATINRNGTPITSGIVYSWSAGGDVSISGVTDQSTIDLIVSSIQGPQETYVQCDVNIQGVLRSKKQVIGISSYDSPVNIAINGDTQFAYVGSFEIPTPDTISLSLSIEGIIPSSYQWYARNGSGTYIVISGATSSTLSIDYDAPYLLTGNTDISCVLNGDSRYIAFTTITRRYVDVYNLTITGGTRNISYDQFNTNPVPSANQVYYATLYKNNIAQSVDVTYQWLVYGNISSVGSTTTSGITVDIADTKVTDTSYIQCTAIFNSIETISRADIAVSRYDATLDWVTEWDDTKEAMYNTNTSVSEQVIAARIIAGTLTNDPEHGGSKRLTEGFAIGTGLRVKTEGGTQDKNGFIAVKDGIVTSYIDTDGDAYFGGVLNANSIQTSLLAVKDGLILDPAHGFNSSSASTLVAGMERGYLDNNEIRLQEFGSFPTVTTSGIATIVDEDVYNNDSTSFQKLTDTLYIYEYTVIRAGVYKICYKIGTRTGYSISWGSEYIISAASYDTLGYHALDTTHIVVYKRGLSYPYPVYYNIGTWNGTSFDFSADVASTIPFTSFTFATFKFASFSTSLIALGCTQTSTYSEDIPTIIILCSWNGSTYAEDIGNTLTISDYHIVSLYAHSNSKVTAFVRGREISTNTGILVYYNVTLSGTTLSISEFSLPTNDTVSRQNSAYLSMVTTSFGVLFSRLESPINQIIYKFVWYDGTSYIFSSEYYLNTGLNIGKTNLDAISPVAIDANNIYLLSRAPVLPYTYLQRFTMSDNSVAFWQNLAAITTSGIAGNRKSSLVANSANFDDVTTISGVFTDLSATEADLSILNVFSGNIDNLIVTSGTFSNIITPDISSGSVLFAGAGGLLSQDNDNFFWDNTNKKLLLGDNDSYTIGIVNPRLQVNGLTGADAALSVTRWSADANPSRVVLGKSRGPFVGTNVLVFNGDAIGSLEWAANTGAGSAVVASIQAIMDATTGATDLPSRLVFSTVPDGSTTLTEYMRLNRGGNLCLGPGNDTLINSLYITKLPTGSVDYNSVTANVSIQSDVTSGYTGFLSQITTQATAFTLSNLYHFRLSQSALGASSAVTNQYGFLVSSTMTGAVNNYGFYGGLAAGTGRWNLYMVGTAQNYLAGNLGIGVVPASDRQLYINRVSPVNGLTDFGVVTSVTYATADTGVKYGHYFQQSATLTSGVLPLLVGLQLLQTVNGNGGSVTTAYGAISAGNANAGATIGTFYGFSVSDAAGAGAITNYRGFRGLVSAGATKHNLYIDGTAQNYLAGYLGIGVAVPLAPLDVRGIARLGGLNDYTDFEADGTLHFTGAATVYNDIQFAISGAKVPAANAPTWSAFLTNLSAYTFAVNDYVDLDFNEIPHDYKEGTDLEIHIHFANQGTNVDARGVKWEVTYSVCNMDGSAPYTEVFPATATVSAEATLQANITANSHIYLSLGTIAGTGLKIGAQIGLRLKRIAAAGTAPTSNPFALQVGIHYECDTTGSRTVSGK